MRPLILISTLTALAAVGACAPATPPDPSSARAEPLRRCFQVDRVQNFRATADQTLYLRTSRRDVFEARGAPAVRELLRGLQDRALEQGVALEEATLNTPYRNTVPAEPA